jgi:hypothetical protein
MKLLYTVVGALALLPRVALAHFILLEPPTWNSQNSVGNPQKTGPCGSEGGTPTGTVTRFRAGETITVRWRETIYHPGHWRIAFAENRADLVDPIVTLDNNQNAVSATIVDPPVAPILMDNLFPVSGSGSNRTLQQQVTLPNRACAHCTLQVMQFMEGHGPPNYLYYHCADIELVMDTPDAGAVPVSDAGTISDAAFPNDGGFVIPDSGVAPQDTGVVAADSGVAEIDGGAEPVDSGAAAIDSGAAAVDTGAAAVDSGAAAVDSGAAAVDSGTGAAADSGGGGAPVDRNTGCGCALGERSAELGPSGLVLAGLLLALLRVRRR